LDIQAVAAGKNGPVCFWKTAQTGIVSNSSDVLEVSLVVPLLAGHREGFSLLPMPLGSVNAFREFPLVQEFS